MDVGDTTAELVNAGEDLYERATDGVSTVADRLHLRRRTRILGLPIGRKRIDWARVGMFGAGTAAVMAGAVGTLKAGPAVGRILRALVIRRPETSVDDSAPDAEKLEDALADLSAEERALVEVLHEVEQATDRAVVSISTLERDDDGDTEAPGWVLTVGLRTEGSDNGVRPYRVVAAADGSLRDYEPLDDAGEE